MKLIKFLVIAGLFFYGIYWFSTDGYTWWQKSEIDQAVKKFNEEKGYYPRRLGRLVDSEYEKNGRSVQFIEELPIPRNGYCWDYDVSSTPPKVSLDPLPEDASGLQDKRTCP